MLWNVIKNTSTARSVSNNCATQKKDTRGSQRIASRCTKIRASGILRVIQPSLILLFFKVKSLTFELKKKPDLSKPTKQEHEAAASEIFGDLWAPAALGARVRLSGLQGPALRPRQDHYGPPLRVEVQGHRRGVREVPGTRGLCRCSGFFFLLIFLTSCKTN